MAEKTQPYLSPEYATRGLDQLTSWKSGEVVLPVNTDVFLADHRLTILTRGSAQKVEGSMSSFMTKDPAFEWYGKDKKGFLSAVKKDSELRSTLSMVTDLVDSISNEDRDGKDEFLTLALTESLLQVSADAAPHIPRFIEEHAEFSPENDTNAVLYGEEEKKSDVTDQEDSDSSSTTVQRKANLLQKSLFPVLNFLSCRISIPVPDSQRKGLTINNHASASQLLRSRETTNPLLSDTSTVGRERIWSDFNSTQRRIDYECDSRYSDTSIFIITQIQNKYNPITGEITTASELRKLKYSAPTHYAPDKIRTRLGVVPATQKFILIPWAEYDDAPRRISQSRRLKDIGLNKLSLYTRDNKTVLSTDEVGEYLYQDDLGNRYLSLEEMPHDLRQKIDGVDVALEAVYSDKVYYNSGYDEFTESEWIGGYTEDDPSQQSYLFPQKIQSLLRGLTAYHDKSKLTFSSTPVFGLLAKYLGNVYLTYHALDAKRSLSDPIRFTQTDRVLKRELASCEGANITLGRLMRYFLTEGEGIAYASGYVLKSESRGKFAAGSNDFHMKVAYKDRLNIIHYFDATPWDKETKLKIKTRAEQYRQAKRELNTEMQMLNETHLSLLSEMIYTDAMHTWDSLVSMWSNTAPKYSSRLYHKFRNNGVWEKQLPGSIEGDQIQDIIEAESCLDRRGFKTNSHGLGDFIVNRKNFKFIKNIMSGRTPINGKLRFKLDFLNEPLLRSSRADPDYFLAATPDEKNLLEDTAFRRNVYQTINEMIISGGQATLQNTEVITEFSSCLHDIENEYKARFQNIFNEYSDNIIAGDTAEFVEGAPFLQLLENPIAEFNEFFYRLNTPDALGFLYPSGKEEIWTRMQYRLSEWRKDSEEIIDQIASLLENAPLTISAKKEKKVVPSTRFWKNAESTARENPCYEPTHLDPIDTFVYLAKSLYFPKKDHDSK